MNNTMKKMWQKNYFPRLFSRREKFKHRQKRKEKILFLVYFEEPDNVSILSWCVFFIYKNINSSFTIYERLLSKYAKIRCF